MKEPRLGSKAVSLALRSQRHISEFEASLFTVSTRATKTPFQSGEVAPCGSQDMELCAPLQHTHQSTRSTVSGWPRALQSSRTPKSPSGLLLICSSSRERFLVNTEQK